MKKPNPLEPNFDAACEWWAGLPNIWTPLGWREHMFRFNVLWNGTILAQPHMNRRTEKWKGLGVQLSFAPSVRMQVRHGVRITFTLPADLPAAASNAAWA